MYSIQGTLKLTSPLHVSAFETSWRLNDQRKAIQGDNGGKPLTRMARQRLVDREHVACDVPFIAGNGFRGRLRRLAAKRVQSAIGPVSMDTYHGLACGAVSGRPAKDSVTISGLARARDNVYLGLFGGGPSLQPSRYRAFDAVPVTDATIGMGMVPERYADHIPLVRIWSDSDEGSSARRAETRPARPDQLLFFLDFNRVDDALRFRDPDAPAVIKDYNEAMADWMAKVSDNKEAVAASKEAVKEAVAANKGKKAKDRTVVDKVSKSSIDAMSAIEVLAPGVDLFFRVDLDEGVTEAQLGLMLLCIADMVKQNRLGGWGRNGLGTFKASLSVIDDGEVRPLFADGAEYKLHSDWELQEAAAYDALDALDASSMADLFKED